MNDYLPRATLYPSISTPGFPPRVSTSSNEIEMVCFSLGIRAM
jgi:hypothetical protein